MQIVALDSRAWGKAWHVPSNAPKTQTEAALDLAKADGKSAAAISTVPAALLWTLGVFNPVMRELRETAYQMNRPYIMDDSAARNTFGMEPTPWNEILKTMVDETKASLKK